MRLFKYRIILFKASVSIMLAITVICSSCQPEMSVTEEGLPATIQLNVKAEEKPDIQTRAVDTDIINDVHILIYDSNGELIGQKYEKPINGAITVNTKSANNCTIYVVANTGDANFFAGYDKHSERSLTDRTYTLANWNVLNSRNDLPMTGKKEKVNITAGSQSLGNLEVTRMAAKIILKIGVASHSGITIKDYALQSVPLKSYYISRPLSTESAVTDINTTSGDDAVSATDNTHWVNGDKVAVNATSVSAEFYMFENRRGVVSSITEQKDKVLANAPAHATYVEINGTVGNVTATWKVYLGANNTSNFNIKRNCTYTYNITLNDVVTADTRVNLDWSKAIDLSTAATANCYIASQTSTWYKFKATVRGNGAATAALISPTGAALAANAPIAPTSAELIWEAGQGTYDIKAKDLIQIVLLKEGYIYFKTGHLAEGNAVIAAKDKNGTILWSWHIWKTSFNLNNMPTEVYQTATQRSIGTWLANRELISMDRNLGAANNTPKDAAAFGMYYQFGRKDPFLGPSDIYLPTATNVISNPKNIQQYTENSATVGTIDYAIKHPNEIIIGDPNILYPVTNASYGNWIYNAVYGSEYYRRSNNLWGNPFLPTYSYPNNTDGHKSIYDPCPVGWRVPPQDVWTKALKPSVAAPATGYYHSTTLSEWNIDMADIAGGDIIQKVATIKGWKVNILSNGKSVYFPAAGMIRGKDQAFVHLGTRSMLWTSSAYGVPNEVVAQPYGSGLCLDAETTVLPMINAICTYGRSNTMPIRCVKETSCTRN